MKKIIAAILAVIICMPFTANAGWGQSIFSLLMNILKTNAGIEQANYWELDEMKGIKNLNQSQLNETRNISSGLRGTHQYGSQYYNADQFSWGSNNWQSILALANAGGGGGSLGSLIQKLTADFPINKSLGSENDIENKYYRLQAQTALASRASAQTAFDQMNNEDQTMKQLHGLIDSTPDNKSAVDLNNRLVAENTMVNIQEVKLLSLLVQQFAIDSQAKTNRANESAAFFDIR